MWDPLTGFQETFLIRHRIFLIDQLATYSPMAGALVSPGDSIPATSKKPSAPFIWPMTKSSSPFSPSQWAQAARPKEVTTCLVGSPRNTLCRQGKHLFQSICRSIDPFFIRNILRCRACQQISVYRRRYQNALSHFRRQLKNG